MKMKNSIASISLGSLSTIVLKINGTGIMETILLAFIGGITGYLGKLFIEWLIKKIKKINCMKLMKKILPVIVLLLAFSVSVLAQGAETTEPTQLITILEWVGGIVLFLVGHLAIKNKWASALHYAELILGWLYNLVKKINDSSNPLIGNNGTKK